MEHYLAYWLYRVNSWGYGEPELWDTITTHPVLYARLAAVDLLLEALETAPRATLVHHLKLANHYMPEQPQLIVALDHVIRHLNDRLDEMDREADAWQRESNRRTFAYQYASYKFTR